MYFGWYPGLIRHSILIRSGSGSHIPGLIIYDYEQKIESKIDLLYLMQRINEQNDLNLIEEIESQ